MKANKWNSVLFYPKRGELYFWDKREFLESNGDLGWREVLGRFYLKYCPEVYYKAKNTYEKIGLPML